MNADILHEYEAFQREVLRRQPRTIENYLPEVADFVRFLGCRVRTVDAVAAKLASVDQATLLSFLRRPTLGKTGKVGPVAWNMRLAAVRSLYAFLVRIEKLTANPALRIERQRTFEIPKTPLSLDEMIRLVDAVRQASPSPYRERNVALVELLIHTALRVHEVIALDVDQVDFEHYLLLSVSRKGGKVLAATINDVVVVALQEYLAVRADLGPNDEERALFVSERGSRFSVRSVQDLVREAGVAAGISVPVTPHVLRHSSATQLAALGTPLRVVQDICGHANITTTTRYVHAASEDRKRAVDALAAAWNRQLAGLTSSPAG